MKGNANKMAVRKMEEGRPSWLLVVVMPFSVQYIEKMS